MSDTTYTMVGMPSSGKTCFLTAMYKQLVTGIGGFTLWTPDNISRQFERDLVALRKGSGKERFPAATPNAENATKQYAFRLLYETKDIISFDIADYAGGALVDKEGAVYSQVMRSMEESTAMLICIDGQLLCEEDRETRRENVDYDCAMRIMPLIQKFKDTHGYIPPIVFVITKSDLWSAYVKDDMELVEIIKDKFQPAFAEGSVSYICGVSLGKSISDDGYKGRFDPVNVHIPLFIASFHEYYNRCRAFKGKIEASNKVLTSERDKEQAMVDIEKRWWSIFRNDILIEKCIKAINYFTANIQSNQEKLEAVQALYTRLGQQLEKESDNFKQFISGVEQPAFKAPQL